MRTISIALTLFAFGCGTSAVPVRVLHTEVPQVQPVPEAMPERETPEHDVAPRAPRIGAPGGSGAGSRRVLPL